MMKRALRTTMTRALRVALLAVLISLACLPARASAQINALAPVEVPFSGAQELVGVAVGLDATVFVSDAAAGIVYRISPAGVVSVAVSGLQRPAGLALDLAGRLLIAEEVGGRVLRLEPTGALTVLATGMSFPRWPAVALDGSIYVSHHGTLPSGADPTEGREILRLVPGGAPTTVATGLSHLEGLAVLIDGSLVASTMGFQSAPSSTGKLLRFPIAGDGTLGPPAVFLDTGLQQPIGLMQPGQFAVVTGLYVAFREASGVIDPTKRGVGKVRMAGTLTSFADHLGDPRGASIGPDGSLYAADGTTGQLLRFRAPPAPLLDPLPAFTNQTAIPVTGSADPTVRIDVIVLVNATISSVVTTTSSATGTFAVSVPLNANALNTLAVFQTPSGGNGLSSVPTVVALTHSNLAPAIAWVQPQPGAFVRQTITLQAQASSGGNGVAAVAFALDGQTLATLLNPNPTQSFLATTTLNTTTRAEGVHLLTAAAQDGAGNLASTSESIIIDNTPPTTRITGGPMGTINTNTATFTFTGTDNLTPAVNLQFAWRLDGGAFTAFSTATSATLTNLTQGLHTFAVKARDLAGNEDPAPASRSFTATFGPTITNADPPSGTAGTLVTITGANFVPGATQVAFNGVAALVRSATATILTTTVPPGATTGPLSVTTAQGSASQGYTVGTTGDFTLTPLPAAVRAIAGDSAAVRIQTGGTGTFTSLVSLSVSAPPAGISAVFSFTQVAPGSGADLTFFVAGTVAPGRYTFTVTGQAQVDGRVLTRTTSVALDVLAPNTLAVTGRVLTAEAVPQPIPGVTVALGTAFTLTDAGGNFLLPSPPPGQQMLLVDGRTASTATVQFPPVDINIAVAASGPTRVPFIVFLPKLDTAHPITLPLDANGFTTQQILATTPLIPGMIVTIPFGTRIVGPDGNPVRQITITPVPVDRTPMPFPPGVSPPMLFTIQPGGAVPSTPVPITFPNLRQDDAGTKADLYFFDLASGGWAIWGKGTVSGDQTSIVSDPGFGQPRFAWGFVQVVRTATATSLSDRVRGLTTGGEPVDLPTGRFTVRKTDLVLPGRIPVTIERTYRSENPRVGSLGLGWNVAPWETTLIQTQGGAGPDFLLTLANQSDYLLTPTATGWQNTTEPFLRGALLTGSGATFQLRFKDGTVQRFDRAQGFFNLFVLTALTDRTGNTVTLSHATVQGQDRILSLTEPAGRSLLFSYDELGRVIAITDPQVGRQVRYDYDVQGRISTVTDPAGGVTRYTYDASHRILSITDPRGITFIQNQYDTNGRVVRQTQADGGVWTFAYQLAGNAVTGTTVTDPRGNPTTYRFNSQGFTLSQTDALGQTTVFDYDPGSNLLLATTDPLGRVTRFTYDANGNVTTITDPAGNVRTFSYEPTFNRVTSIRDPLGNVTSFSYDVAGNLTAITDPLGARTAIAYNAFGQPVTTTDPLLQTTTFAYDGFGNLSTITDPLGNATRRTYDAASRLITQADPRGQPTSFSYDPLNRLAQLADALGGLTRFSYDGNGNLLTVTDARGNSITHTYDSMDRLATRRDPVGAVEAFAYDGAGNLIRHTDRKGQVATFTYDALNRRAGAAYADGSTTSFTYDSAGRLIQASDSVGGTILNAYDTLDRVVTQATGLGTISYQYDALGRRTRMDAPGQASVFYGYDAASRLRTITQAPLNPVSIAYDALGRRTLLTLPNGVSTTYQYDAASRLTALIYQNAAGLLGNLTYQYDQAGNRTRIGGSFARTLLPDPIASATYDAANRQLTFGDKALAYDANGSLASLADPSGLTTFTWDARNRLLAMMGPNSAASFGYDAFGRRITRQIVDQVTHDLYNGVDIVQEVSAVSSATYLRTPTVVDELLVRNSSEYVLSDGIGSVLTLTDSTGAPATSYHYEPFGRTSVTGAASGNPFHFTGRENEGILYHYRARYFSPALMRFISEDPAGLAGGDLNLFAYVWNSPCNYIDPLGLTPCRKKVLVTAVFESSPFLVEIENGLPMELTRPPARVSVAADAQREPPGAAAGSGSRGSAAAEARCRAAPWRPSAASARC